MVYFVVGFLILGLLVLVLIWLVSVLLLVILVVLLVLIIWFCMFVDEWGVIVWMLVGSCVVCWDDIDGLWFYCGFWVCVMFKDGIEL